MKQTVSMITSTLYMTVKPSKPFNPILGETYEGYLCLDLDGKAKLVKEATEDSPDADVFKVFAEQTSHHPPISNFLIESKIVRIYGHYELSGNTAGNTYLIKNQGPCYVHFLDTNQRIRFQLPDVALSGILWGSQSLTLSTSLLFQDKVNDLKCHISFDSNDGISGAIYKYRPSKLQLDCNVAFSKVGDISQELMRLKGNWQKNLIIDGDEVWNIGSVESARVSKALGSQVIQAQSMPLPNPLPSDCRYREDLIWLKRKDIPKAEQWKLYMEEQQRYDEKLRKK